MFNEMMRQQVMTGQYLKGRSFSSCVHVYVCVCVCVCVYSTGGETSLLNEFARAYRAF